MATTNRAPHRRTAITSAIAITALLALAACSPIPADRGESEVRAMVTDRTGLDVQWARVHDAAANSLTTNDTSATQTLTAESAARLALARNRTIQAAFEDLGIAQADLQQAGTLSNPVLAVSARFPNQGPSGTNLEYGVVQSLMDLFVLEARQQLAGAQLDQAARRVALEATRLVTDVRAAYFTAVAHRAAVRARAISDQTAQAALALATRQHEAGAITDLELARHRAEAHELTLDLRRAEDDALDAHAALTRLLGPPPTSRVWSLPDEAPAMPALPPLEGLVERAYAQRLDLALAHGDTEQIQRAVDIERDGLFTNIKVGVSRERDPGGVAVTGPNVEIEVPLFDQHQAAFRRFEAQQHQAKARAAALEDEINADVHAAHARATRALATASYIRDHVLPDQDQLLRFAQQQYDAMTIGAFELLSARRDQAKAQAAYAEAAIRYWSARIDLERAVGGTLSEALATTPSTTTMGADMVAPAQPTPPPTPAHHHHGEHP